MICRPQWDCSISRIALFKHIYLSLNECIFFLSFFFFFFLQGVNLSAMGFCSYLNCNSSTKQKGLSFFGFPKDKFKRQRWCNLIKRQHGRDNFDASKATLCQKHFCDSDVTRGFGSSKGQDYEMVLSPFHIFPIHLKPGREKSQHLVHARKS